MKRKIFSNKSIKILIIMAVLINIFAYSVSAKNVTVGVLLDNRYNANISTANADITAASGAFLASWNINLTPTSMWHTLTTLPINTCNNYSWYSPPSGCLHTGTCTNNSTSTLHHANAEKNLASLWNTYPTIGWGLMMGYTSLPLCLWYTHPTTQLYGHYGVYGVAYTSWKYSYVSNWDRTSLTRVRVIQHEFSHNYGCSDTPTITCSTVACIMKQSFDNIPLNSPQFIWCGPCTTRFNPNLH